MSIGWVFSRKRGYTRTEQSLALLARHQHSLSNLVIRPATLTNPIPMNLRKHAILAAVLLLSAVGLITAPAQTVPESATPSPSGKGEVLILNPFTVNSEHDYGYRKTSSITTSRIGVSMYESPQAVEIISGELLNDLGLNSVRQAFDYTSSVTSNKQETFQSGTYKLRGFELPQSINRVNLAQNSNGPGYTTNDNIERIEIAKGPVGLFYGNNSPNGLANIVTKRPEGVNKTKVELDAGSLGYQKALVDTQAVVSKEYGLSSRVIASVSKSNALPPHQTPDSLG